MSGRGGRRASSDFELVVRRTSSAGPLAPYRFALGVAFALLVAGRQLWAAFEGTGPIDEALLRALLAGVFIWIVTGAINRILVLGDEHPLELPSDGQPRVESDVT